MSPDPFEALRAELVRAAARQRVPRQWQAGRRRTGALGLALVALGGTATAAVVTRSAEESAPLAGSLAADPKARGYAASVAPDLRAGAIGWCSTVRVTSRGRPTGSLYASACGAGAITGSPVVTASSIPTPGGVLRMAIVTRRVATVVFPGGRRITTRPAAELPFGWRAAIVYAPGIRRSFLAGRPAGYEDADGKAIPVRSASAPFALRGAGSRKVTVASPATRCVIGAVPGFDVAYARVAVGAPKIPKLEDPVFASCARTVLRARGDRARFDVAILRDAEDPAAAVAPLPRTPGLSGRRLGPAWLVVSGGTAGERRRLLAALDARL